VLTNGMHAAQRALARYLPLIRWSTFRRRNLTEEMRLHPDTFYGFACGDEHQAVVWLVRRQSRDRRRALDRKVAPERVGIEVPGLAAAEYRVTTWNTEAGREQDRLIVTASNGRLAFEITAGRDLAIAIQPAAWREPRSA
jgi:mannan endo-1,4-beta-mannosidase